MNDFIAAAFGFIAIIMFIVSFRFMAMGWSAAKDMDEYQMRARKERLNEQYGGNVEVVSRRVTKGVHPEMADVKNGDELLVVKFGDEEPKDPLLSDLEARINTLNEEKRGDADEEGGLVVRR